MFVRWYNRIIAYYLRIALLLFRFSLLNKINLDELFTWKMAAVLMTRTTDFSNIFTWTLDYAWTSFQLSQTRIISSFLPYKERIKTPRFDLLMVIVNWREDLRYIWTVNGLQFTSETIMAHTILQTVMLVSFVECWELGKGM